MYNIKCSDLIVNNCYEPKVVSEDGLALPFDFGILQSKIEIRVNHYLLVTNESLDFDSYDQEKIIQHGSYILGQAELKIIKYE